MAQQSQQDAMNAQRMTQQAQQSAMSGMRMGNEAGRTHRNAMDETLRGRQPGPHHGEFSGGGLLSGLVGAVVFVVWLVIAYAVVTGDMSAIPGW